MNNTDKSSCKKWILIIISVVAYFWLGTLAVNAMFYKHEEPLVYVTNTGECYHSLDCSYLRSVNPIGLEQAQDQGYRSCSRCGGEAQGVIEVNEYGTSFTMLLSFTFLGGFASFIIWGKYKEKKQANISTSQNYTFNNTSSKIPEFNNISTLNTSEKINKQLSELSFKTKSDNASFRELFDREFEDVDDFVDAIDGKKVPINVLKVLISMKFDLGEKINTYDRVFLYDHKNEDVYKVKLVMKFSYEDDGYKEIYFTSQLGKALYDGKVGDILLDRYVVLEIKKVNRLLYDKD